MYTTPCLVLIVLRRERRGEERRGEEILSICRDVRTHMKLSQRLDNIPFTTPVRTS